MKRDKAQLLEQGDIIIVPDGENGRTEAKFHSFSPISGNIFCTIGGEGKCFYLSEVSMSEELSKKMIRIANEKGLDK